MRQSISETIERIHSLCLFVREDSPHLIFRLEPAESIGPSDPGFLALLRRIYDGLEMKRPPKESEVIDVWALDLWEYNHKEYDYFSQHPEEFTGFSECGIARVLSHIALSLDLDGPTYLFVMYDVSTQAIDLKADVSKDDYETFLEALPF
jgi:hypothetical protein